MLGVGSVVLTSIETVLLGLVVNGLEMLLTTAGESDLMPVERLIWIVSGVVLELQFLGQPLFCDHTTAKLPFALLGSLFVQFDLTSSSSTRRIFLLFSFNVFLVLLDITTET